jgi:multicomponent K+:H+ antiporter subunit E
VRLLLFFFLLALWLVLNESLAPGHVALGAAISLAALAAYSRLQAPRAHGLRRPLVALRLAGTVVADIARSNFAVARIVMGLGRRGRTAGFLAIPLALRDPAGLAALACIVTATPGTSWVRYERSQDRLTLHVLDLEADGEGLVRDIKRRYERPLMEIFE